MSRTTLEKQLAGCIVALACALSATGAWAAANTYTWTGTTDNYWLTPGNWTVNAATATVAPGNEDTAVVNLDAAKTLMITNAYGSSSPVLLQSLIIGEDSEALTIATPSNYGNDRYIQFRRIGTGSETPRMTNIVNHSVHHITFGYRTCVQFNNYSGDVAVMPGVIYNNSVTMANDAKAWFLPQAAERTDNEEMNKSVFKGAATFTSKGVSVGANHWIELQGAKASFTVPGELTVNGKIFVNGGTLSYTTISGEGTVCFSNATINATTLDATATIILKGSNTLKFGESDVTIGKLVFADPSATLTLSGTGNVSYSTAFESSTCLTAEGLYVPADYKAAEADGVISVTASYDDYVKNNAGITSSSKTSITWENETFWSDSAAAAAGKRYLIDGTRYNESGSATSVRLDSTSGDDVTFPGDVLTLVNGSSVTAPTYLALKATKTTIANLRLGEKGGVDFRPNSNTAQTLAGAIHIVTGTSQGAVIRGNRGLTNVVESTISGEGILRIAPLEKGPGFTAKLTADNSAFTGKIFVDWYNSGDATAALIVDNANQLGGDLAKFTKDALRLNEALLVVNETMSMPENRGVTFLRNSTIEVAADKTFTVGKSTFYTSEASTLTKTGAGSLILSDEVTITEQSKTIKLAAGTLKITGSFSGEVESGVPGMMVVKSDDNTTYTLTAIVPEEGKESVVVPVNSGTEVTNAVENIIAANKNPTGIYTYTNSEGTKVTNTCVAVTNELSTTTVGVMADCTVATFLDLSQLTVSDKLYVYGSDGKYAAWQLDETAGVRSWSPMAIVSGKNELEAGAPATTELNAGQAAVLVKAKASKAVQLFTGEIAANPEVSAAAGASLSCLPSLTAKKVSTIKTTAAAASVDGKLHIYVPGSAATDQYTSTVDDNGAQKWVKRVDTVTSSGKHLIDDDPIGDAEIPAGMGMWIQNQSGSSITIK